jgi:rsbT co-antagonist protein RsbR
MRRGLVKSNAVPEALLRDFFTLCPEMLFIAGMDGKLQGWGDALADVLGPAITPGIALEKIVHADDGQVLATALARLQQSAGPVQFELRLRGLRGAYVRLSCRARRSPEGDAIFGSFRRVTAPGDCPRILDLQERLLEALASHMDVCIWAVDSGGTFFFHDGKGLARAGLKPGQWLGMNIFELYGENEGAANVRRALAGEVVHAFAKADGVEWENWMVPVRSADGTIEAVMGFTLDVSEARRTADELRDRLRQIEKQQEVILNLATTVM